MEHTYARGKMCVLALGGNSLIKKGEKGTIKEQEHNAEEMTRNIFGLIMCGYNLVITHGNGPQVGNALIRNELAADEMPPMPLDVCVADTEGSMGYILQQALLNELRRHNMRNVYVVTMITQVMVEKNDPAFSNPTKPIGPFPTKEQAEKRVKEDEWHVIEDAGRGYRRVVPSPRPVKIIQRYMIRDLCRQGNIVIALGGGGIPVIKNKNNDYEGIEAVIDKDLASAELAKVIHADLFMVLTGVPGVYLNYNKSNQRPINKLSLAEAKHYLSEGQFPPGSMGPKIQAAIEYLNSEDGSVIITDTPYVNDALEGKAGTIIKRP
ncbi:MAG: carbamate kinase [Planctomycetota bacterium]